MPIAALPPTVFAPLTSNESLIVAIQAASGESHSTVLDRLLAEEECLGINVRRDAAAFGLKPYVWSDQLIEFYRSTKSFLYETAVWNRTPLKQQMREWIGRFLQRNGLCTAKVLTFGDGLGFDSTFLALLGCDVTYYEPSEECSRFALSAFQRRAESKFF